MHIQRNLLSSLAFGILVALSAGCGGGGSGGSGGGGGGPTPGTVDIEASIQNGAVWIDPRNLEVGDTVQFVIATYSTSGVRTVHEVSGWTTTDSNSVDGVLLTGGGLSAASSSATTFVASVSYAGTTYRVNYRVNPDQVRIATSVESNGHGTGIPGINIIFYNNAGTQVGAATSAFDGSILASVPTSTTSFIVDESTINTQVYYSWFGFGELSYAPLDAACVAPLPSGLTNRSTVSLAAPITLLSVGFPPPPPPSGCTG